MFFIYRLFKISTFNLLPKACGVMTIMRFLLYMTCILRNLFISEENKVVDRLLLVSGLMSVGNDVLVAGTLLYFLWKRRQIDGINEKSVWTLFLVHGHINTTSIQTEEDS